MARTIRIAAAQMGATHRTDERPKTLGRMLTLLQSAASQGAQLVLFPEIAFTTFFPRYLIDGEEELESWFEHGDIRQSHNTKPLFDAAHTLGVDISVGFAEATDSGEHFNTSIYYHAKTRSVLSKYRKIHLPGTVEPFLNEGAIQQLEKRYFKVGDLGWEAFRVPDILEKPAEAQGEPIFGMMICNDRRWAEAWRVLGLQGVEVVLCGFNTAGFAPDLWGSDKNQDPKEAEATATFHHKLCMQAYSYTNACFSISAARAGYDDGHYSLIGGSCITDPEGKLLAETNTTADELIVADCNLDLCTQGKTKTFDFARHRRPEHYRRIIEQTGVIEPPRLAAPQADGHIDGKSTNGTATKGHEGTSSTIALTQQVSGAPTQKQIRILLINPNATKSMTDACIKMVAPTLNPDTTVFGLTSPAPAPLAVEGNFDNIMSAAAGMRAIMPIAHDYDAFLVACYSDHALIRMLREEFSQPTIGIMEASLFAARTLGNRFGVIATSKRSKTMHEDSIRHYGFDGFCAGVGSCNLGVLDLERKSEDQVLGIMCGVAEQLVEQGADCLTLGCAGMARLKPAVERAVGEDVQVIDGVLAGVQHLAGLVRMGGRTAKVGMYKSSATGRKARGQTYY